MWLNVVQICRVVELAGLHQAKQKVSLCACHLEHCALAFYDSLETKDKKCFIKIKMTHYPFSNLFFFSLQLMIIMNGCSDILHGL